MLPTLRLLQKSHSVSLILCDQHSTDKFGPQTTGEENGFQYIRLGSEMAGRTQSLMDQGRQMARAFKGLDTHIILVIGDRLESLVAASVATGGNIPIAHIEGGDITGGQDEPIRHAISKLAHVHFCSNEDSANRLRMMGEEERRIHVVGDVHIDQLMQWRGNPREGNPYVLGIFHPNSLNPDSSLYEIEQVLDGVFNYGLPAHFLYPCSDPGHEAIIDTLEAQGSAYPEKLTVYKNLGNKEFVSLLEGAEMIVGNSSCGIKEAPYLGVPAVNIGGRQEGRPGVAIDCECQSGRITEAMHLAARADIPPPPPYGDGVAYRRIAKVLTELTIGGALMRKRWNDYSGAAYPGDRQS